MVRVLPVFYTRMNIARTSTVIREGAGHVIFNICNQPSRLDFILIMHGLVKQNKKKQVLFRELYGLDFLETMCMLDQGILRGFC